MEKALRAIHDSTLNVYEKNAEGWDKQRSRSLFEKTWLDRFIAELPPRPSVLDVGCGAGEPIASYFLKHKINVTGLDAAKSMIDICRSRFPGFDWIVMDMRALNLTTRFDGIVGWDSFFHLDPEEQRQTLRIFMDHLNPGGALLLTVGPEAGEVVGHVEGAEVYHSSLSFNEYQYLLSTGGFENVTFQPRDIHCGGHSILLASQFRGTINGSNGGGTLSVPPLSS